MVLDVKFHSKRHWAVKENRCNRSVKNDEAAAMPLFCFSTLYFQRPEINALNREPLCPLRRYIGEKRFERTGWGRVQTEMFRCLGQLHQWGSGIKRHCARLLAEFLTLLVHYDRHVQISGR